MYDKNIFNKKLFIRIQSITVCLFICIFIQTPASAGIYKWVDDEGQIHYSEHPVGNDAEKIKIRTNETTKPRKINQADKKVVEATEDAKKKAAEEKQEEVVSKKEKRQYCNEAKHDLAVIQSRGRLREINAKGEYTYLSESQRQQRITAAQKKKREFCK